eukprot:5681416-Pyramimonas_sp.AAC.1
MSSQAAAWNRGSEPGHVEEATDTDVRPPAPQEGIGNCERVCRPGAAARGACPVRSLGGPAAANTPLSGLAA